MPFFAGALAALLALFLGAPASAAHRLSITLAPQFVQVRDDLLPAVRFFGPGGTFALGYHHERLEGFAEVVAQGALAGLSDRFTGGSPGWGLAGGLALIAQAQQALWASGALTLQAGGILRAAESLLDPTNWDDAHAYWLTDYDLGPVARLRWQCGPQQALWAQVNVPLVSLIGRPPVSRASLRAPLRQPGYTMLAPQERLALATLDTLFTLRAEVAWRAELSAQWALQAGYELAFTSVTQPAWLLMLNQSAHVRVLYAL